MRCQRTNFRNTAHTPVGALLQSLVGPDVLRNINRTNFGCSLSERELTLCKLGVLVEILKMTKSVGTPSCPDIINNAQQYLVLKNGQMTLAKLGLLSQIADCPC